MHVVDDDPSRAPVELSGDPCGQGFRRIPAGAGALVRGEQPTLEPRAVLRERFREAARKSEELRMFVAHDEPGAWAVDSR